MRLAHSFQKRDGRRDLCAGPPSVNFEGPHAILLAIGPRHRLISTLAYNPSYCLSLVPYSHTYGGSEGTNKLIMSSIVSSKIMSSI